MNGELHLPADEPAIIMKRTYDAPRELVWQAITEPRHVRAWWGGKGASNPVCDMDVRPGGIWSHVLELPSGQTLHMKFRFLTVERPERLVWEDVSEGSSQRSVPSPTISVRLEANGSRTVWTMEARFPSIETRDAAVEMGFAQPIAASGEQLIVYLQMLQDRRS